MKTTPVHPGAVLEQEFLKPLKIPKAAFAKSIGISAPRLGGLTLKQYGISADMALRLSIALNTTPEYRMELQSAWDLAQARKEFRDAGKIPSLIDLLQNRNMTWPEIEKRAILAAFKASNGSIYRVASELGIAPNTAYRKLREYGIELPRRRLLFSLHSGRVPKKERKL